MAKPAWPDRLGQAGLIGRVWPGWLGQASFQGWPGRPKVQAWPATGLGQRQAPGRVFRYDFRVRLSETIIGPIIGSDFRLRQSESDFRAWLAKWPAKWPAIWPPPYCLPYGWPFGRPFGRPFGPLVVSDPKLAVGTRPEPFRATFRPPKKGATAKNTNFALDGYNRFMKPSWVRAHGLIFGKVYIVWVCAPPYSPLSSPRSLSLIHI